MKKVLFVANIAKHIIRFHLPYLKWFKENGYEVHVAANGTESIPFCDVQHNLPIYRSPFSLKNIRAHRLLKNIIDNNNFTLVHGHTPMGGVLSRTASVKARKKGTKVLYTAHGFHFYKGAPRLNWFLYFSMEKLLAPFTDAIITINSEDFEALSKYKFGCKYKFQIPGIGINTNNLIVRSDFDKIQARAKLGLLPTDFVLIYVAEFIDRKNHQFIVHATQQLKKDIPAVKVLFAGRGVLQTKVEQQIADLQLDDTIKVLGFRNDIVEVISLSDVGISGSKQEGLGLNLAEEMFCGLPVVATEDRGHKEMIKHGVNGFLYPQNNSNAFVESVFRLYADSEQRIKMGKNACDSIQRFRLENSLNEMIKIYHTVLDENV